VAEAGAATQCAAGFRFERDGGRFDMIIWTAGDGGLDLVATSSDGFKLRIHSVANEPFNKYTMKLMYT